MQRKMSYRKVFCKYRLFLTKEALFKHLKDHEFDHFKKLGAGTRMISVDF
jgi:hypothetical protein